ncbi:translation initiation factor eIF5A [Leucoagaricus gongylophorus]
MSDDEQHNQDFDQGGAGASHTYPVQCSTLRKNGHVMLKGHPCKIVEMSTSKTGKHGHAKVNLVGQDIFTGKKYEDMSPSTHNMEVPVVRRSEYPLVDISGDFMTLMTPDGNTKEDTRLPEGELGSQIQSEFESGKELLITCVSAVGMEQAISFKEAPQGS